MVGALGGILFLGSFLIFRAAKRGQHAKKRLFWALVVDAFYVQGMYGILVLRDWHAGILVIIIWGVVALANLAISMYALRGFRTQHKSRSQPATGLVALGLQMVLVWVLMIKS